MYFAKNYCSCKNYTVYNQHDWQKGIIFTSFSLTHKSRVFCFCFVNKIQWNPVNKDTKGTCQSVRIIRVSALSGLTEKHRKMSRTHVLSIQKLKQTFLRQQDIAKFLNCDCNKFKLKKPCTHLSQSRAKTTLLFLKNDNGVKVLSASVSDRRLMLIAASIAHQRGRRLE